VTALFSTERGQANFHSARHLIAWGDLTIRGFSAQIKRQLVHLTRLIDDLLDANRMSLGSPNLRREPIELASKPPGTNHWTRVSWDEAFARIARLMKDDRDRNFAAQNENGVTIKPCADDARSRTCVEHGEKDVGERH
jgi:anaerobic selenocysteine-containing dehydrogenase